MVKVDSQNGLALAVGKCIVTWFGRVWQGWAVTWDFLWVGWSTGSQVCFESVGVHIVTGDCSNSLGVHSYKGLF